MKNWMDIKMNFSGVCDLCAEEILAQETILLYKPRLSSGQAVWVCGEFCAKRWERLEKVFRKGGE